MVKNTDVSVRKRLPALKEAKNRRRSDGSTVHPSLRRRDHFAAAFDTSKMSKLNSDRYLGERQMVRYPASAGKSFSAARLIPRITRC